MKSISYKLTFFFIISFFTSIMFAYENDIEWEKTFGAEYDERGRCVQETFDGGFIVTGYTYSYGAGQTDVYLLKTDSHGNKIWEKTFGAENRDYGTCVKQTYDGGYIISGYTESYGAGSEDVYLIKTNSDGQMQWEKTFGASNSDVGYCIQQTFDGGYIISGYTDSYGAGKDDVYLIKTDPNGNKQWEKTFGGSNNDYSYSVLQTSDAGYIIAGETKSFGAGDYLDAYLIKTDPNGNKKWEKTIGRNGGTDGSWSLDLTSDGGYIIAGPTDSIGQGKFDVYLVKINEYGNTQWEKTFGSSSFDTASSVQQTFDGGYIIAGYTYQAGNSDVYLIKTDSEGNALWEKTLGGSDYDSGFSIQQTSDGGYIVSGATKSFGEGGDDVYLVKLDHKIIYVDDDSTGTNDGTSWENAYTYLQDALADANSAEKPIEIRVAQGVYTPDSNSSIPSGTGNRDAAFKLINGISLKGGYAGVGGPDPDARDTIIYKTILSGDLSGNDIDINNPKDLDSEPSRSENSYHVVTSTRKINNTAILDGFTITAGNNQSNDFGGGIDNNEGAPTLKNCTVIANYARGRGGGMNNFQGRPVLTNCSFIANFSGNGGGGMYNTFGDPTLINCLFSNNFAPWGGGIHNWGCSPVLIRCIFSGNQVNGVGGGIWSFECSSTLTNCIFIGNLANDGGAMNSNDSSSTLVNCILWNNTPDSISLSSNSIVTYSNVQGGWEGLGNIDVDPLFVSPGYWADVSDPNIVVEPDDPNAIWIEGDYHLKSEAGRWDPNSQSWVIDDITSSCIDAGDPNSDWSEELWPHGKRINMGAYGGTTQASMSLSDIGDARDLNNDDLVNYDDVLMLVYNWDSNNVPLKEDLDLNGKVDSNDLILFEGNWEDGSTNNVPVLEHIEDQYVNVGNELDFPVAAFDSDSDELVYLALGLPEGVAFEQQVFSWTPSQIGTYPITFIVSDHRSLDFMTVKIFVKAEE